MSIGHRGGDILANLNAYHIPDCWPKMSQEEIQAYDKQLDDCGRNMHLVRYNPSRNSEARKEINIIMQELKQMGYDCQIGPSLTRNVITGELMQLYGETSIMVNLNITDTPFKLFRLRQQLYKRLGLETLN